MALEVPASNSILKSAGDAVGTKKQTATASRRRAELNLDKYRFFGKII
jgi:hypothetical protein